MHKYDFHIGDYAKETAHLSNEEDICYRRLLDLYYDKERPIPIETESVSRRIRVGFEVTEKVLKEFFYLQEDGWHSSRCDKEIGWYKHRVSLAKENGKLGGRPKKTDMVSENNQHGTQNLTDLKANLPPSAYRLPHEESTTLSDSQANTDIVSLKNGKAKFAADALEVIKFLNLKTGRKYRPVFVNLDIIASRLKEGATLQDCKSVIAKKAREWSGNETMEPYLRPATLFNRTKFAQYVGELVSD